MSSIARRYATAFFEYAEEQKQLDGVFSDLEQIKLLCGGSEEFGSFLNSPVVRVEQKVQFIESLFKGKVQTITLSFLKFLTSKKRLAQLTSICNIFHQLYFQHKKITLVQITSAVSLGEKLLKNISSRMEKIFDCRVDSRINIKEELIGGFKIKINDTVYDHSVRSRLDQFKKSVIHGH